MNMIKKIIRTIRILCGAAYASEFGCHYKIKKGILQSAKLEYYNIDLQHNGEDRNAKGATRLTLEFNVINNENQLSGWSRNDHDDVVYLSYTTNVAPPTFLKGTADIVNTIPRKNVNQLSPEEKQWCDWGITLLKEEFNHTMLLL